MIILQKIGVLAKHHKKVKTVTKSIGHKLVRIIMSLKCSNLHNIRNPLEEYPNLFSKNLEVS